jgi:hypothetical protein
MKYYDLPRYWTKRVMPHLGDPQLQAKLIEDCDRFIFGGTGELGRLSMHFKPTLFDHQTDWEADDCGRHRPGPRPRYYDYTLMSACHWLVNFNLMLAERVAPNRPWRIITSKKHSTVWDGKVAVFEFNYRALRTPADTAFANANRRMLKPGKLLSLGNADIFEPARINQRQRLAILCEQARLGLRLDPHL